MTDQYFTQPTCKILEEKGVVSESGMWWVHDHGDVYILYYNKSNEAKGLFTPACTLLDIFNPDNAKKLFKNSKFTRKELIILEAIGDWEYSFSYKYIVSESGLDLDEVKSIIKKLRNDGYVKYNRGLIDDDGMVAGSGHGLNRARSEEIWNEIRACGNTMLYEECCHHLLDTMLSGGDVEAELIKLIK